MYLQDDIRVRKNLTLSPGVRYEAQTHLSDYNNVGPRFGVTWSPGKSGKTTLRGSAGIFYDWLSTGIYEQTLRVDGFRQRELNIINPPYPEPGKRRRHHLANKPLLPGGRPPDAALPPLQRRRLTHGDADAERERQLRAHERRQPDARPEPERHRSTASGRTRPSSTSCRCSSDAESRQHTLNVGATINFNVPPRPSAAGGGPAPAARS